MNRQNPKKKQTPVTPKKSSYLRLVGFAALVSFVLLLMVFFRPFSTEIPSESLTTSSEANSSVPVTQSTSSRFQLPLEVTFDGREVEQERLLDKIEAAIAAYPMDPSVIRVAGLAYAELSRFEQAAEVLSKGVQFDPKDEQFLLLLANVYMQSGKHELAVETLSSGIGRGTASATLHFAMGDVLSQLGRTEEAIVSLKKALEKDSKNTRTLRCLAQAYVEVDRFADAEQAAREAVNEGSTEFAAYAILATALARQGKRDEAQQVRDSTPRTTIPTDPAALEKTFRSLASERYTMLASVHVAHKSMDMAESHLVQALKLDPTSATSASLLADLCHRQGRGGDCLAVYNRLVEIQPDNMVNYWNLSSLAVASKQPDLAEKTLAKAAQLDSSGTSDLQLAKLLLSLGRADRAVFSARRATDKLGTVDAYLVLINALQMNGDMDSARKEYMKAKKLAPNDPRLSGMLQCSPGNSTHEQSVARLLNA